MSALASTAWLALLLGWMAWGALSLGLEMPVSLGLGLALGVICAALFRDTLPLRGIVAVLGPVGIVLPLLILRQMAAHLGAPVQPFGAVQLLLFVVLYIAFLASAAGALPVDLYRLGYAPWPVAIMVLALCVLGFWQGALFVPVLAVAAQAIWAMGGGSSNWFDHVLHPALVPAALIVLVLRLV
ncbi:hypothetical protein DC366_12195 [Pelagivirga sediminicola]|uniref:Uncharacterized protein n=1 Tax=Pelagivirga sediminicola TaxID=2170575 RepID=A0A2T7G675_9RHOB|nr:hypothetical protein [Pelagivirga sediminicola]PVA09866.1 hypothetical protein DC366_12195 [Pelagivirga sediminicola]